MFTDRVKKCTVCKNYNGRYNPDSVFDNTKCANCQSESKLTDLKIVTAKDGKKVMTYINIGTVCIAGAITKYQNNIDTIFIKSIIKSEESEVTSGKGA